MSPTEFVIRRSVWLRGEGPVNSMLLRPSDGKQCCIGIYLSACGVTDAVLKHTPNAGAIKSHSLVPAWLVGGDENIDNATVNWLYRKNDARHLDEEEREASIKHLFAKAGIKVTFVD